MLLLSNFPIHKKGKIVDYVDNQFFMPLKIIEMGLLPSTDFRILYSAPFNGPLYVEFGLENSKIALRKEEAKYIIVEDCDS